MNIKNLLCMGIAAGLTVNAFSISASAALTTNEKAVKSWTWDSTATKETAISNGTSDSYPGITFGTDSSNSGCKWYNKMVSMYIGGYIKYTPEVDGTISVTGKSRAKTDDKNKTRWIGFQSGTFSDLSVNDPTSADWDTSVTLLLRADVEIDSNRITTSEATASFDVKAGTDYYLCGNGSYVTKITFTPNSYAAYDTSRVFTGDSDTNDKATAVVFTVGSNTSDITYIDTVSVTYNNETKATDSLNITTDGGTVLFGVIVPEAIENMGNSTCANTFAVNVK